MEEVSVDSVATEIFVRDENVKDEVGEIEELKSKLHEKNILILSSNTLKEAKMKLYLDLTTV